MADLSITAAKVAAVKIIEQMTGPIDSGETLPPGTAVRLSTTTGCFTGANGSSAGEARCCGVVLSNDGAKTVTVVRKGIINVGDALGDLTYDDDVFLSDTDKTLADAQGTVSLIVGTVVPGLGSTTPDKLLRLDL